MKLIDILNERQYKTDKHTSHDYIQTIYDPMFEVIKDDNISLCRLVFIMVKV